MNYIQGQNRNQITIFPVIIDSAPDADNELRYIFVAKWGLVKHTEFTTGFC